MKIEHIGLMVRDLEAIRQFYEQTFGATAGVKYENPKTGFSSYFLTFPDGLTRLEIGTRTDLTARQTLDIPGYAHLAISLGSRQAVDSLSSQFAPLSGPRVTSDGYYEAVILDPEGNQIELTV